MKEKNINKLYINKKLFEKINTNIIIFSTLSSVIIYNEAPIFLEIPVILGGISYSLIIKRIKKIDKLINKNIDL